MSERSSVGPELAESLGGSPPPQAARPSGSGQPQPPSRPAAPPSPHKEPASKAGAAPPPEGAGLDPPVHTPVETSELLYFGVLAPVETTLTWSDQVWEVSMHVLTVDEENKLAAYVARQPDDQKQIADATLRLVYALRSINGQPVSFNQGTPVEELRAKMQWVSSWPYGLLTAGVRAYAFATMQPVLRLQEMRDDPNSIAVPS